MGSSAMGGAEDEDKACKIVSAVLSAEQMLNKHKLESLSSPSTLSASHIIGTQYF